MSSSKAPRSHAQESPTPLAKIDLTTCAFLSPESPSAHHSAHLPENKTKVAYVAPYQPLPSPSSSCSEDKSWVPRTVPGPEEKGNIDGSRLVIVLGQSRDDEKFDIGSGTGNDVVLRHPSPGDQDDCYINLTHLQIYPDPDRDAMVIYNRSSSEFGAYPLRECQANMIEPGHRATLGRGAWRLTLGTGLTFQIEILPRPHETLCVSPKGVSTSVERYKARYTREKPKLGAALEARPRPNPQKEPSPEPPINIAKTAFTEVFKCSRNGTAVAVKVCRKPELKHSADMWRNEIEILNMLDHSSVVRLLERDAATLSLELEYIGPDLSQSVDKQQLSQLSENQQYQIWRDVARGIEHIHAQRIIHRDIKPENILLGGGDRGAVICDFGISTKVYQKPETYNGGTPCYVPPEYLFNLPRGFEGDIWAFGVTMLFVFRLIPLPRANWAIAAVHQDPDVRQKMIIWLRGIRDVVKIIPKALSSLRVLLAEDPKKRTTAAALAKNPLLQPLDRTLPASTPQKALAYGDH